MAVEACTLPTAEQPLRVAEFAGLFAEAVRGVLRMSPTLLRLELDAAAQAAARELAVRESECCSFFSLTITPTGRETILMDVTAPAGHTDVLDGLTALARTA